MSKADGSVIIDTHIDTKGVDEGTEKIKDKLGSAGKESEKAGEKIKGAGKESEQTGKIIGGDLVSSFLKLGKTLAASAVVGAVVDFGKECIELGSDLEEVQNVVDVTFETMSDDVNQFARDAQKSAGLSEKMAKQYVGTFGAMADSFGFTETEAYEMSTALTQLTGDVASFYNLSQDEAMNKLKGVFTGETEALKELGVVMTQTALDNYSLANGFGKTTAQMTEQEKVALRYQFVMDQLSAASGDFVRTQDSWANQTKVLSLQWESLMATLGSGLIDALLPGIEFLNDKVLPALQDFADGFAEAMEPKPSEELRKSMNKLDDSLADANKTFNETSAAIDINATKAELYRDQLVELEAKGLTTAESQREYANAVNALNEIYPDLNLKINENTGLLDANSWAQLQNLDVMKQRALAAAQMEQYNAQVQAWAAAENAVVQAEAQLGIVEKERASIQKTLQNQTGLTMEQMIAMYNANLQSTAAMQNENMAVSALTGLFNTLNGTTNTLTASQLEMVAQVLALTTQENALKDEIAVSKETVAEYDAQLKQTAETYGIVTDEAGDFASGQEQVTATAENATASVKELQQSYLDAKESARDSIDSQIGLFSELEAKSDLSAETIVENWKTQQAGFDQYKQDLQKATELGLDETLVKQLSDGSKESMAILHNLVTDTDLNVDEFNEQFQKTEEARETVSEMMAAVQTDLADKFAGMAATVSQSWDGIDADTRAAISSIQGAINRLTGRTIYIDTIHRNYYESYGSVPSSTSYVAGGEVPYLAKGTVIPPNAPFMAVLGDQRHGTNIEAPLSTIQEAVATVIAEQAGTMEAGINALIEETKALRHVVENVEIGDSTIGQAVSRYNQKLAIMRGG